MQDNFDNDNYSENKSNIPNENYPRPEKPEFGTQGGYQEVNLEEPQQTHPIPEPQVQHFSPQNQGEYQKPFTNPNQGYRPGRPDGIQKPEVVAENKFNFMEIVGVGKHMVAHNPMAILKTKPLQQLSHLVIFGLAILFQSLAKAIILVKSVSPITEVEKVFQSITANEPIESGFTQKVVSFFKLFGLNLVYNIVVVAVFIGLIVCIFNMYKRQKPVFVIDMLSKIFLWIVLTGLVAFVLGFFLPDVANFVLNIGFMMVFLLTFLSTEQVPNVKTGKGKPMSTVWIFALLFIVMHIVKEILRIILF